ncbi:MAG: chemotaxis protein CheD [Oscillospiraceae bacterium]|jgi:chemotaxis protein CheD
MSKTITVGIADFNVAKDDDTLVTYALGSCVGICLYDPVMKLAGLSHIMLPSIKEFTDPKALAQTGKYADSAIELLMNKMISMGARKIRLRAKIAGGAQMFAPVNNNTNLAGIGERNVIAVKKELARLSIPIVAEDTGKNYGRTLFLSSADGVMRIKSVNKGEWTY